MKLSMPACLATLLAVSTALGLAASAPDDGAGARPACAIPAAPEHALLRATAGTWDAAITLVDPSGAEHRVRGTLTRSRLGDYHVADRFEGTWMGLPMVGQGLSGFCTARGKHFSLWTDSMTPSPMTLYGDYDEVKRELTLGGECFGPGGGLVKCRTVTRFEGDDRMTWSLFAPGPDGRETRCVSIEYTRGK